MATYRIISTKLTGFSASRPIGFTAEVTFRSGIVEVQRDFSTEAGALDWVAERLVGDVQPAREG
jgi:hypothetical protein